MKKLIVAGILSSSLFLAACAAEKPENDTAPEKSTNETVTIDTRTALVNFHMAVIDNFKDEYQTYTAYSAAVTAYEEALAAQADAEVAVGDKPTAEKVAELEAAIGEVKANAEGIADASAEEIRNFAIPTELEASSDDIKSALDDLAKFFEEIKVDIDNTEAYEAYFQSFNDKMGVLFVAEELPAPNYFNALK